jgi:hypothetical protein
MEKDAKMSEKKPNDVAANGATPGDTITVGDVEAGAAVAAGRGASASVNHGGVTIGDVTGGIHGSVIAGGDVSDATITFDGRPSPADKERAVDEREGVQVGGAVSPEGVSERIHLAKLRQILVDRFDEGELRTLCFDLGVDYDSLPGVGKADKAREIVAYLERREQIYEFVNVGRQYRSDIPWEAVFKVT